jgi:hypothetical protein
MFYVYGSTSRNPVDLNQSSVEARQLVQFYLTTEQRTFGPTLIYDILLSTYEELIPEIY